MVEGEPSNSGSAALQKNAISAMATNSPSKRVVKKNTRKPARLAIPDNWMMTTRRPTRSDSQPHMIGATILITCISDISTAISVAGKSSD